MKAKRWEVIKKINGGWWVLFSGLADKDEAEMIAVHHRGFAQPEETDDVCLPVVEWE